ncbi:hypothetical protein KUV46_10210 [Thalassovita mediterranea]|nr:hypothetical protein KUV46_10210 [Thalassovita mediterranea]
MPSKKRAKGYSANLLDMSVAQTLSDEDAKRLTDSYALPSSETLKDEFAHWSRSYRNDRAMYDEAPSTATVRDTARELAKRAAALADELNGLDGRTAFAVASVKFDDTTPAYLYEDFAKLKAHRAAVEIAAIDQRHLDLEVIAAGVRVLQDQAQRTASRLEAIMEQTGQREAKPFNSAWALIGLIGNIKRFWEHNGRTYSRYFDDFDDETGGPAATPKNDATKFTVELACLIDPILSAHKIDRAMKEHSQHFDS